MRALHWAAAGGHEEVVGLLLGKGARPNPKDEAGLTPLMMAAEWGHVAVVWMLAQQLGTQGLDQRTSYGWTALHYAAEGAHDEAVCCLLMCGADPRIRNKEGKTPRGIAEEEDMWGRVSSLSVFQVRP
jgi:ankyrin repeat protein